MKAKSWPETESKSMKRHGIVLAGCTKKKVMVLEVAHNHVFNYRLFTFSGDIFPDIIQICHDMKFGKVHKL